MKLVPGFKKHELVNICLKDNILKATVSEIGTGFNLEQVDHS